MPIGWYNIIDENGNDESILVFENQIANYERLKKDLEFSLLLVESAISDGSIVAEYFNDFGVAPPENELRDLVSYYKLENKFPELQTFAARDKIDPYKIAIDFIEKDFSMRTTRNKINEIYSENHQLIDNLYGSREYYERRIIDFMMYPDGVVPFGTIIEEVEKEFYKLDNTPFGESLEKLLNEVIAENYKTLGKNFICPTIFWTDKDYKSYFAVYLSNTNQIKVNRVLDSKTVSRDVLKFLIYHECLHQLIAKHNREFRNLEHLYPNFDEYENFLDVKFPDFYRDYAM